VRDGLLQALLWQRAREPFLGAWSLPGGYLDPGETLSPGQYAEIDRVYGAYPDFNDDAFVAANLERWLAG